MQIHQLRPKTRSRHEKRVGRGDKTAGRGTKGQRARAGAKIRPAIRDVIKKLPKRRGYRFRSFRPRAVVVDLAAIARAFPDGAAVNPAALLLSGLIHRMKGRVPAVKVVGSGAMSKRLYLRGLALSAAARERVLAAGGSAAPAF